MNSIKQSMDKKEAIRDRLYVFANCLGISIKEIAKKSGVSETTLYSIDRFISNDYLLRIYRAYPQLNPMWLQMGDGVMLREIKTKDMEIIKRLEIENERLAELVSLKDGQITRLLMMLEDRNSIIAQLIEKIK